MSSDPHIVIIGAGLIGLSTADECASRGAVVSVIDGAGGPGLGASFCNSGMIHPSQAVIWHQKSMGLDPIRDWVWLGQRSQELILANMKRLGLEDVGRNQGLIQIFKTEQSRAEKLVLYDMLNIACEPLAPCADTYLQYGIRLTDEISGNAWNYCRALEVDLRRRGVRFFYDVSKFEFDFSGARPTLLMNPTLLMKEGSIEATHIIIAAGHASGAIAAQAGLSLSIGSARGHALNFSRPDTHRLPNVPIMDDASRSAMTVFPDHVRLSGTMNEPDPICLLDIWGDIAPELVAALGSPLASWSGERPVSEMGFPLIAPTAHSHIWVHTAHAHMGWTLCAGSAEKMADLIWRV